MKAGLLSGLCALVLCFSFVSEATAQSTRELSNRLNRLENEMDTISRSVYKGETPPPSFNSGSAGGGRESAAQEVRIQQLESELRNLTGQIEQQNFKIRQMEQLLEKVTGDLGVRIQDLERAQSGGSSSSSPASQYISPGSGGQNGDGYQWNSGSSSVEVNTDIVGGQNSSPNQPAALYENAFSLLKQNKYDAAEKQFKVFVDRYPEHVLAGNAKYWLGETYYVRGQYDSAVRIFAEAYQQYPKSAKAPDNLLKLGMSLAGQNKKDDACVALSQLKKEFSSNGGPVLRRGEQESKRLGCK